MATFTTINPSFFTNLLPSILGGPVTPGTSTVTSVFSAPTPQIFATVPFPNNQLTLYTLKLRDSGGNDIDTYTFPLTPAGLQVQYASMHNFFDVRGPASQFGVQRIVDQYGVALPVVSLSGTTGFQFHTLDGYQWSGRNSIKKLLQIINNFTQQVQNDINNNTSLHSLIFEDTYNQISWSVIPYGQQTLNSMDNSKPLYNNYALQLLAIQDLSTPPPSTPDPVANAFVQTRAFLATALRITATNVVNNITTALGLPSLS